MNSNKSKTLELVWMALLSAILLLGQIGMSALPNVEIVTPLIIIYTLIFRKKVFYIIYTFVFAEGLLYGFGIWWVNYLYVWAILALIVLMFREEQSIFLWAILAGAFGLLFGLLCSIPYFVTAGIGGGFAYWTAGIPFDITHCIGNVVTTAIIFKPVYMILNKIRKSI